jgi:hypothetical protein
MKNRETFIVFNSPGYPGRVLINVNSIQLIYEQGNQTFIMSNGNAYRIDQSLDEFMAESQQIDFVLHTSANND